LPLDYHEEAESVLTFQNYGDGLHYDDVGDGDGDDGGGDGVPPLIHLKQILK
jgi:hypothetical protein